MNTRAILVVLLLVGFTVGIFVTFVWAAFVGNLVVAGVAVVVEFVGFEVVYKILLKPRIKKWIAKS